MWRFVNGYKLRIFEDNFVDWLMKTDLAFWCNLRGRIACVFPALLMILLGGVHVWGMDANEMGGSRWEICDDGAIRWVVDDSVPHYDHIEMSGEKVSAVLRYGVNADGSFSMERSVVWPMLRTVPNDTHASLTRRFGMDFLEGVMVNRQTLNNEQVDSVTLDGKLTVVSRFTAGHTRAVKGRRELPHVIEATRVYFPSTTEAMLCERYILKNIGERALEVVIPACRIVYETPEEQGVYGSYTLVASTDCDGTLTRVLAPGESFDFGATIQGYKESEGETRVDVSKEMSARDDFCRLMRGNLVFESPDAVLNTEFAFAKIRACESIFRTKGGLMQGPGGEAYYAAIWANDQAEYINPFFPYMGYATGNESAVNAFMHFARFMNDEYRPIPSSIIAEGDSWWGAAGDRGDCAMIGYGAARYALASGDREQALRLWPLIEWCLEYSRRKTNDAGVVASDSDELEGRFPSGDANLCTSSLHYDALSSAAYLADELGKGDAARRYRHEAAALRGAIGRHFAANVEGFEAYRYYDGNDVLRSWICMPLVTGIFDRKEGTVAALLSPRLSTPDGLLTQSGTSTYWDRTTLYALRGIFAAGERDSAIGFMRRYSTTRLLGDHVPYPIEAWPEGNQRHLSTESALYCRIVTEGMFGMRPTGLKSFDMTPQLPEGWPAMALRRVCAYGVDPFDVVVTRRSEGSEKLTVSIERDGKRLHGFNVGNGETVRVKIR